MQHNATRLLNELEAAGTPLTVTTLARRLGVNPNTASRHLARLQGQALVKRNVVPGRRGADTFTPADPTSVTVPEHIATAPTRAHLEAAFRRHPYLLNALARLT